PTVSKLEENAHLIEMFFASDKAATMLQLLEESNDEWAKSQAKAIRRSCPLSVAATWQMVKAARSFGSIGQALSQEYRFCWRSLDEGDVLEGTRALIIDKDRNPQWKVKRLEEVTDEMVSSMLASLGENELDLGAGETT
ncbi:MAG: enoyl-CoA hydratase/isomerase family protein, partial [Rhizobiaceae bacterium]|nr:enoyl-CoA hydratase/isomerase family protein [Rhizobiaceae bacterium]